LLKEIAASALMIFLDRDSILLYSPDGRRKLEDNLTEINIRNCCNVSILVDHLRVKSDGRLAGWRESGAICAGPANGRLVLHVRGRAGQ
jgi:hypothetical protein